MKRTRKRLRSETPYIDQSKAEKFHVKEQKE